MSDAKRQVTCIGLIPARWGSTRFPGKPLHKIAGLPMIQHVWQRCAACVQLDHLAVATDDARIADCVEAFGGSAVMTAADHPSGSDRLAEALKAFPNATHVINIQGDEPLISPNLIDQLAQLLRGQPELAMVSAACELESPDQLHDPNVVKVVMNSHHEALYFSRSAIPFLRSGGTPTRAYRHLGIYGFKSEFLRQFVKLPHSPLEQSEQLEQLRAVEHGIRIKMLITEESAHGVDTPEQAIQIEQELLAKTQISHS